MAEALRALKELFRRRFGAPAESSAPLEGDGSARKLLRLKGAGRSVIGVVNTDRLENLAFIGFSRHFRAGGLPVPEIHAEDLDRDIYLEEDLGDTTLFDCLSTRWTGAGFPADLAEAYRKAVRLLPEFQVAAGRTLDYSLCHPRASFDKQSMLWDLNYFKYYFLRLAKIAFSEQALEDDFARFADFLLGAPRDYFLYRDFQSRNIMLRGGEPWFIDYQGGRKGALQYDIASLLFDAKADLPFALRERLLERYLDALGGHATVDRARFKRHYPGYVYVRIMQAMGAYGLRGFYEGKVHFLQSIPYAVRNLEYLMRTHEFPSNTPELEGVIRRLIAMPSLRTFGSASLRLTVRIHSFSYKNGLPTDDKGHGGGFVFDCRALPNPGRLETFAPLTGRDEAVVRYLDADPAVRRFLDNVYGLLGQTVENYKGRNFTDLLVAFGCTGGRHRSVYCAERLAAHLRERYRVDVEVHHREDERPLTDGPPV